MLMMPTARFASALFVSAAFLANGCNKGPADGVVATVNGHAIQQTDVDKIYNAQLAGNPQQQAPSRDQADTLRLNILHELITEEVIEQRAAKQNLTATDAEVDAKLTEMKAPYTEDAFQTKLKAASLTLDQVRHDLRRSLTQNKLLSKEIESKISVTDLDVANYFNAHKAEFNLIDNQYHLAQIIVSAGGGAPVTNLQGSKSNSEEEAKRKIQALKNRLDSGEDFGMIASNFSENQQTAQNNGDMGMLPEGQVRSNPLLYNAISRLKPGQTTDIIPFPDQSDPKKVGGYAIFKLIDRAAAGQREIDDPRVQQTIRQQLRDGRAQLLKNAYLEMLHDQAKVENYFAEKVFKSAGK